MMINKSLFADKRINILAVVIIALILLSVVGVGIVLKNDVNHTTEKIDDLPMDSVDQQDESKTYQEVTPSAGVKTDTSVQSGGSVSSESEVITQNMPPKSSQSVDESNIQQPPQENHESDQTDHSESMPVQIKNELPLDVN